MKDMWEDLRENFIKICWGSDRDPWEDLKEDMPLGAIPLPYVTRPITEVRHGDLSIHHARSSRRINGVPLSLR